MVAPIYKNGENWVLLACCWAVFVVCEDTGQPEVAQ